MGMGENGNQNIVPAHLYFYVAPLALTILRSKQHLDRFSCFCTICPQAHVRAGDAAQNCSALKIRFQFKSVN